MEKLKYSPEEQKWAEDLVRKLADQFPDANIHVDEEYFIYDVVSPSGEYIEVHTPKWPKIPLKNPDDSVDYKDTKEVIRNNLKGWGGL